MRKIIINIMLFIIGIALSRIYFFIFGYFISKFYEIEESTGISFLMFYLYFIVAIPLLFILEAQLLRLEIIMFVQVQVLFILIKGIQELQLKSL